MKQAQSESTGYYSAGRIWAGDSSAPLSRQRAHRPFDSTIDDIPQRSRSWGELFLSLLAGFWFVVSLPFRIAFWTIAWLGRIAAVAMGFMLMVVGMALWAGPLFLIGIPLFLAGLVLTLRCLD